MNTKDNVKPQENQTMKLDTPRSLVDSVRELIGDKEATAYTSLAINSRPKTLWVIWSEPHWYERLNRCEHIIREKEEALESFLIRKRERDRSKVLIRAELEQPKIWHSIKRFFGQVLGRREWVLNCDFQKDRLLDELQQIDSTEKSEIPLVRDAISERETAITAKRQILSEHPEAEEQTYDQLQDTEASTAFLKTLTKYHVAKLIAQQYNIPEAFADLILSHSEEVRDAMLAEGEQLASDRGFGLTASSLNNLRLQMQVFSGELSERLTASEDLMTSDGE